MWQNNNKTIDQRTSDNDVIDIVQHAGQKKKQNKKQKKHAGCTFLPSAGQETVEVSRQRGTDYVCKQMIGMQVYLSTYRSMCSNQRREESTGYQKVFQHASKRLPTDSDSYLTDQN